MQTINDLLLRESGRFHKDILQKTTNVSPWLTLVTEGPWPEGMGNSINVPTFGRTLPASTYSDGGAVTNPAYDANYFTDVGAGGLDNASANNCSPPTLRLRMGTGKVPFALQHFALESQPLCVNDLRNSFEGPLQIQAIKKNLADVTRWVLTEKYRRDFTYWAQNKVVVTVNGTVTKTSAGGVAGAESFNTAGANAALKSAGVTAPSPLTQALLQHWSQMLWQIGAQENCLTMDDGAPVYALLCSAETSRRLKTETEYRQDFRWSDRADELLKALQVKSAPILGFQHLIDVTPPRWNYTGGAWVKVEPYYIVAAPNGGYQTEVNPAYDTAQWEDSIIFHKDVINIVFPGSVANSGGTGFSPVNYRGMWDWRNVPEMDPNSAYYNPDGTMGFFRGIFMLGGMPRYTDRGVIIRHARCEAQYQYDSGGCTIA